MAKYRIKQLTLFSGYNQYEVQKKVWFIPFWYNFKNINRSTTGVYDTPEDAKIAIECDRYKAKIKIISVPFKEKEKNE